jgi:hypothetical protein
VKNLTIVINMKIDKLDAHDRLLEFNKKQFDINECAQDLLNKRPFGNYPFYIFAHPRTDDDGVTKRLIWQPRLSRPLAQTNAMLFKGYPGTDLIKKIWMIPDRALWGEYKKGYLTESQFICECIHKFTFARHLLDISEEDDLPDWRINMIYSEISREANKIKPEI